MPDADKKELERRIIEITRQRCRLIPQGALSEFERPDWLIPSACTAIEVSQLLPEKSGRALFSPPQVSEFQKKVVDFAERHYRAFPGAHPADVRVYFTDEWIRRRDTTAMGRTLAEFVRNHYPAARETVILDEEIPDGFAVIRITAVDGGWGTGAAGRGEYLTYERLKASIASKNRNVAEYRARLAARSESTSECAAGWQLWLLLATRVSVHWSLCCPPEVDSWFFPSDFDRVVLAPWDRGVLEINTWKG